MRPSPDLPGWGPSPWSADGGTQAHGGEEEGKIDQFVPEMSVSSRIAREARAVAIFRSECFCYPLICIIKNWLESPESPWLRLAEGRNRSVWGTKRSDFHCGGLCPGNSPFLSLLAHPSAPLPVDRQHRTPKGAQPQLPMCF